MPIPHLRFEFIPDPAFEGEDQPLIGRRVLCHNSPIGKVRAVVHVHEDGENAFTIINLGSTARVGDDRRAVPLAMLAVDDATGDLVLKFDVDTVRRSPIYVEGRRCDCTEWLERVASYYART